MNLKKMHLKKYKNIGLIIFLLVIISCQKIEQEITSYANIAKNRAEQKVKETVNKQMDNITNSHSINLDSLFVNINSLNIKPTFGRVFNISGKQYYVFRYPVEDSKAVFKILVNQPTTDESRSSDELQYISKNTVIDDVLFIEGFIPINPNNQEKLSDRLKSDEALECYKIKRFPKYSTVIYSPKTKEMYHFVEIKK